MSRLRVSLLSLLAVFAFSAVAVSAAQAEGPEWIVKAKGTKLKAGETRATKSVNVSATFQLTSGGVTITCKIETDPSEIIGGNPGTDKSEVTFKECSVAPKTVAECAATSPGAAKGEIKTTVKTVLVYPNEHAKSTTEALDAFVPQEKSNLFATFTLEGTNCGLLNKKEVKVEATGTEIEINAEKRKCGVLAEVGKIVAGPAFKKTVSGEVAVEGALNLPTPAITKAELEEGKTFAKITCTLKTTLGAAEEIGLSKVETVPAEAFGWEV